MPALPTGLALRALRDDDADAIVALVAEAYAEYPGCVLDLDGVDSDLRALATTFADAGGRGWVVTESERVVACVGAVPSRVDDQPAVELERLYVGASQRRRGVGRALVRLVEQHAADEHGVDLVELVELWTDTRFADAHRLYESLGYVRRPETRRLHDPSDTTEYHYTRELS